MRGIEKWPETTATVTSTKIFTGYRGSSNTIHFSYVPKDGAAQKGKIVADDNASLYGIGPTDTFQLQYDPSKPSHFYCKEAKSINSDLRIVIVSGILLYFIFLIVRFAERARE